jgi:hypothetical protein
MKPHGLLWLAAACLVGCTSSSSSPSPVPAAAPALGSAAAKSNTYEGVLIHTHPSLGAAAGWQIRNLSGTKSVPVNVTNVQATARILTGKLVLLTAHSATGPGGKTILEADSLTADTAD